MVELNYKPSHSQLANAITSVMLVAHHNRILLTIPPGKGKSRVVCAIATLFKKVRKSVNRIFICFSSDILHETDKQVYASLNQLHDIEIKLVVGMKNVAEQIGPEDLLILDEADYHLFDDVYFRRATLPKCKGIIGLTATSYQVQGGVENEYLKKNKFSLIDSRISNTTEEAELLPIKLEDFFSNSQDRTLLIFC